MIPPGRRKLGKLCISRGFSRMSLHLKVVAQLQSVLQSVPLMSWRRNTVRLRISGAGKGSQMFQMSERARRTHESN